MATAPTYCTHRQLKDVFPQVDSFDNKRALYGWVQESALDDYGGSSNLNIWYSYNTGLITQLYKDGAELYTIPTSNLTTENTQINVGTALTDAMNVDSTSDLSDHDILKIGNEYIAVTDITDSNVLTCVSDRHLFGTMSVGHAVDTSV